jgi:hypothetical protein
MAIDVAGAPLDDRDLALLGRLCCFAAEGGWGVSRGASLAHVPQFQILLALSDLRGAS